MQSLTDGRLVAEQASCHAFGNDHFVRLMQTCRASFDNRKAECLHDFRVTRLHDFTKTMFLPIRRNREIHLSNKRIEQRTGFNMR